MISITTTSISYFLLLSSWRVNFYTFVLIFALALRYFTISVEESSPSDEPTEMDFKRWFEEYTAFDANELFLTSSPIKLVQADDLDPNFVEQRIQEATPKSIVGKGFCIKCQELFDDWPTVGGSSSRQHDSKPDPFEKGWETTVARSISTFELEASTRAGCRFCAFMLQNLKDCKLLEVFRKVEAGLYQLGEDSILSLSIQNCKLMGTLFLHSPIPFVLKHYHESLLNQS